MKHKNFIWISFHIFFFFAVLSYFFIFLFISFARLWLLSRRQTQTTHRVEPVQIKKEIQLTILSALRWCWLEADIAKAWNSLEEKFKPISSEKRNEILAMLFKEKKYWEIQQTQINCICCGWASFIARDSAVLPLKVPLASFLTSKDKLQFFSTRFNLTHNYCRGWFRLFEFRPATTTSTTRCVLEKFKNFPPLTYTQCERCSPSLRPHGSPTFQFHPTKRGKIHSQQVALNIEYLPQQHNNRKIAGWIRLPKIYIYSAAAVSVSPFLFPTQLLLLMPWHMKWDTAREL